MLVAKNLPANAGDVRDTGSLGWEDSLEEGMAIHSSILAWRIPWTEEPGWLQSTGIHRVRHNWSDLVSMHMWHWLIIVYKAHSSYKVHVYNIMFLYLYTLRCVHHWKFSFHLSPYMLIPFTHFSLLPTLSYLVTTTLFSVSTYPFLFHSTCKFIYFCVLDCWFYIPHIRDIIQYLFFSIWLISLSIIHSRVIHIVTNGKQFH